MQPFVQVTNREETPLAVIPPGIFDASGCLEVKIDRARER